MNCSSLFFFLASLRFIWPIWVSIEFCLFKIPNVCSDGIQQLGYEATYLLSIRKSGKPVNSSLSAHWYVP